MKFMIEFQLKANGKNDAIEAFEQRGPNRTAGVRLYGAWIGKQADVVFVLVESDDEARVEKAAQSWGDLGQPTITAVIDIEQY